MPYLVLLRRGISSNIVVAISDTKKTPIVLKEFICAKMESNKSVLDRAKQFALPISKLFNPALEIKEENL